MSSGMHSFHPNTISFVYLNTLSDAIVYNASEAPVPKHLFVFVPRAMTYPQPRDLYLSSLDYVITHPRTFLACSADLRHFTPCFIITTHYHPRPSERKISYAKH